MCLGMTSDIFTSKGFCNPTQKCRDRQKTHWTMQKRSQAKVNKEKFKLVMADYITKETFGTEEQRRECLRKRKETTRLKLP